MPPRTNQFLLLLAVVASVGVRAGIGAGVTFTRVTEQSGIQFLHVDGRSGRRYILETVGSGVALFDADGDGLLDIYMVNAADLPGFKSPTPPANRLYRNNGDGTFTDVTSRAGVGDRGYGAGCAVADYNNDGDLDLYVTNFGPNVLYINNGDGTFSDVTEVAGVGDGRWSLGCAFADYDNDGFVDLYVANYIDFSYEDHANCTRDGIPTYCPPESYFGSPDTLYHNDGDGTFSDVTRQAGVYNDSGQGMGVVFGDYDGDGLVDCYVGNDVGENYLYHNEGDGTFTSVGWMAGVEADENGTPQGTMGVDFGDYDNDGRLDIIGTNYQAQPNALYHNEGDGWFQDVSFVGGLGHSLPYVGWGTDFLDVDNDGDKDIFIANGHLEDLIEQYDPTTTYAQLNNILINEGTGTFTDRSAECGGGLRTMKSSRALASGDLDHDGDLDLLITNASDTPDLLRNDGENRNHWILIRAVGTVSNRSGIGTRIRVQADELVQVDEVRGGSGYLSQHDLRLHFGLGQHEDVDLIEVRWPSGIVDVIHNVEPNRIITVREGAGLVED